MKRMEGTRVWHAFQICKVLKLSERHAMQTAQWLWECLQAKPPALVPKDKA